METGFLDKGEVVNAQGRYLMLQIATFSDVFRDFTIGQGTRLQQGTYTQLRLGYRCCGVLAGSFPVFEAKTCSHYRHSVNVLASVAGG
jgi:hypothetical protein